MRTTIFLTILLTSLEALAAPIQSATSVDEKKPFSSTENHVIGLFSFEKSRYSFPAEYQGEKESFKKDSRDLFGLRLGAGPEWYLGKGFDFGFRGDVYYLGTAFERGENPDNLSDSQAREKNSGQLYGADAVAHLGWNFDYKIRNPLIDEISSLTGEFFVEAGAGLGQAWNRKNYYYRANNVDEYYQLNVSEKFASTTIAVGFNAISRSGYLFFLRAAQLDTKVSEVTLKGRSRANGTEDIIDETLRNVSASPLTLFSIGGGYKF